MKQLLAIILVAATVSSCSTSNLAHKPSKREIRKAMSYSTSDYAMPRVESNTGVSSRSNLCFHTED
jgi:hypothetical protein